MCVLYFLSGMYTIGYPKTRGRYHNQITVCFVSVVFTTTPGGRYTFHNIPCLCLTDFGIQEAGSVTDKKDKSFDSNDKVSKMVHAQNK